MAGKTSIKAMREDVKKSSYKIANEYEIWKEALHLLRILPPKEEGKPIYFGYCYHKLPSGDRHICLKETKFSKKLSDSGRCPTCAYGNKLFRSKDEDEVAEGKKLYRIEGFISNVIDVRNPDAGVQVIRYGVKLKKRLVELFGGESEEEDSEESEEVDYTDPKTGGAVKIRTSKGGGQYNEYGADLGKLGKPIPYKKWERGLFDLEEIIKGMCIPLDDIRAMLAESTEAEGLGNDEEDDDDDEEESPKPKKKGKVKDEEEPDEEEEESDIEEEDDEEDEEDEEDTPKPKKKKKKVVEEEEEETEDEDEEEEPKKKKKAKAKNDEEEESDEDEEPVKKSKKKAKAKDEEDEEEEEIEEDDDDEGKDDEEEEDDEPAPKKKKSKK